MKTCYSTSTRIDPSKFRSEISTRKHPQPSLKAIKECCQHYEEKAAGNVSTSSPLARYLFNLSREIQSMTDELTVREKRMRVKLRTLESVSEEWNTVFGDYSIPDTAESATPGALLQYLNRLELTNAELERRVNYKDNVIANMKTDHDRRMAALRTEYETRERDNLKIMRADQERVLNELLYEFRLNEDRRRMVQDR